MNRRKLIAMGLVAAMTASLFAGCGSTGESGGDTSAKASSTGRVYYLNMKPEVDGAWQDLAAKYTEETGVPVEVLTAASGTYNTTMAAEMAKDDAPTIFNVSKLDDAKTWNEYTYDMKNTSLYDHLSDKSLVIENDGKIAGVANCYECYGLIYNKKILEDYCSLDSAVVSSIDEINNFETLKAVCDDINSRVDEINDELGTDLTEAIASPGLDDGSSWRFSGHLTSIALYYQFRDAGCNLTAGQADVSDKYLDNMKNVWDMYITDTAANPSTLASGSLDAESEFGMEEAVFYQNGDWEYSPLTNPENGYLIEEDDLAMMPIYYGVDDENEGLAVGTENYWGINSQASQEDIDASLAFLEWVITSDEGRDAFTNQMGLTSTFDTFTGDYETSNKLAQCATKYVNDGKTSVAWSYNATPNVDEWRAGVVSALVAYSSGSGDWDGVVSAFVDGWAEQWALAHEGDAQ